MKFSKFSQNAMMALLMAGSLSMASCGNDHEPDPKPNPKPDDNGWVSVEGKKTTLSYGYIIEPRDCSMEVEFSNIDYIDAYMNPEKYVGKTSSSVFFSLDYYDEASVCLFSGKITGYYYREKSGELEFNLADGKGYSANGINFSYTGSKYAFVGSDIVAKAFTEDEDGGDIYLDEFPKISYKFTGNIEDLIDLVNYYDSRSIRMVKVSDPDIIKFIKSNHNSVRKNQAI